MAKNTKSELGKGWANKPDLLDLKHDLDSTKPSHDLQVAKVNTWLTNLHVKSTKEKKETGRSSVQPKLIRKQAEWRYTSLSEPFLNTPNIFNVEPVTFEDLESAEQNALLLNNQFNTKIDKINFVDTLVRRVVDEGTAIIRVGWKSESEQVTSYYPIYEVAPTIDPAAIEMLQQAIQLDPTQQEPQVIESVAMTNETGVPHWYTYMGEEEVEEDKVTANHPTAEICELANVYVDPSCGGDIDKAQYIVYSFETSKSDLIKAGVYHNLDNINISSNSVLGDADHTSDWANGGEGFKDEPRKKIVAYEYWGYYDIHGKGTTSPIVATWVGDTLIRLDESPYPDRKLPFVLVPYLPVKDSVYGEPDGELLEDNQKILGAVTRGVIDLMARSANGQTGFRKGALDVLNRRKFDRGKDYEFNGMGDAQQSIYTHTFPEVPMSAYNMITMQNQEAESLSGIKSFGQGITGAGLGDTATHARGALDAAARRELGILRRLSDAVKKVGRKFIAMNQEFLEEEEVVRVTNSKFVPIRRDDLGGNFDLELRISTAEADEQKAQELAFMLQTTGQEFGLEMYKTILSEIADLRRMPHLAENIRNYNPEPSEQDKQMSQLELQAKQLENAKIQAEINKINAEAQAAMANAGNRQADTDKKNLDFIEQEAGIAHQRNLEKDSAQAAANMELEVVKDALNNNQLKPTGNNSQGSEL